MRKKLLDRKLLKQKPLKQKLFVLFLSCFCIFTFAGCGKEAVDVQFKNDLDTYCSKIETIDEEINQIDATSEMASQELLGCLDDLNIVFASIAKLDFPAEFDYLESLASEAGEYMNDAVEHYHSAFANESFDESLAASGKDSYTKACRRLQIILKLLNGESPEDAGVTMTYE